MNKDKSLVVATELPFDPANHEELGYASTDLKLWQLMDPDDTLTHYCVTSHMPADEEGPEEIAVIPSLPTGEPLYVGWAVSFSEDTTDHAKALIDYGFAVASDTSSDVAA